MTFIPSTDKQKSLLAHQISRAHDGSFERCLLDRAQLERFKELNLAGMIDRETTSDLIRTLDSFVEVTERNRAPAIIEAAKKTLNQLMARTQSV